MSRLKKILVDKKILLIIILIGAFFRFIALSTVPPSPSLDEVSIGYNSYSLMMSGKDEYGTQFPILLRAYDDFRPALYVYLVLPLVAIFNLDVLAVRLPSVLLSSIALFAVFYLLKELFPEISIKNKKIKGETISLITTLLLAISPWHIYISRLGHEVNAGYSFFILGLLFLLKRNIYIAATFLVLSFASYQTEKVFIPLMCLFIGIIYRKELLVEWKKIVIAITVSIFILLPFLYQSLSDEGMIRFKGTNIISANESRYYTAAQRLAEAKKENNLLEEITHNRRVITAHIIGEAYISHFNPSWLFTNSGKEPHKIPNLGLLYMWEAPFILLGLFILFICKNKKAKLLIIFWGLLAPLSSSITTDAPHAMRFIVILPIFQLLTSLGLITVYVVFMGKNLQKLAFGIFILTFIISSIMLFRNYFFVFPREQSNSFQYALHQAIYYVRSVDKEYDYIVFSNNGNLYQSYMFFLYNYKYDPSLYQRQGGTKSGGYAENHVFDKYEFRPINLEEESIKEGVLYIIDKSEYKNNSHVIKSFSNLDGKDAIYVLKK